MTTVEELEKIIHSDSREVKLRALELETNSKDPKILELIISVLDDSDIEIRGEAFSTLLLNENDISDVLIENLKNQSKNVRGYSALILANRSDRKAISKIVELTSDQSAMVRSCAVGALGYLRATQARLAIRKCLDDPNIEVRKSAIRSAIDIGDRGLLERLENLQSDDPEMARLVSLARNNLKSGPGGI